MLKTFHFFKNSCEQVFGDICLYTFFKQMKKWNDSSCFDVKKKHKRAFFFYHKSCVAKLYRKAVEKNKQILNKCKSFWVSTNWIKFKQYPHRVRPTTRKHSSKHWSHLICSIVWKRCTNVCHRKLVHNYFLKKVKSFNIHKRYEKSNKI